MITLRGFIAILFLAFSAILVIAATETTPLSSEKHSRLNQLGAGSRTDLTADDFALVEEGFHSSHPEDRHFAYLAIEKFCSSLRLLDIPEYAASSKLIQSHMNQVYLDRLFPQLLNTVVSNDLEAAEFASRAVGACSHETSMLTTKQIADAGKAAAAALQSPDFERRRIGVNLLGDLICRFDEKNKAEMDAIGQLIESVEDWHRSNRLNWNEWEKQLSAQGSAKQRFQNQAVKAFLLNCQFIRTEDQTLKAYELLTSALGDQTLDLEAVPSMAALASRLPNPQRQKVIQLAIAGISNRNYWHDIGSGISILRNYSADALIFLAPLLDKNETQQALKAIASQSWKPKEKSVFQEPVRLLKERLKKLN